MNSYTVDRLLTTQIVSADDRVDPRCFPIHNAMSRTEDFIFTYEHAATEVATEDVFRRRARVHQRDNAGNCVPHLPPNARTRLAGQHRCRKRHCGERRG
jgi:hypothetical protein